MSGIPIIRIEVESMKQAMLHAFNEQMLNLDVQFKAAVEDACKPEKVQAILTDAANRFFEKALKEEMRGYFEFGEGRKHIADMVKKKMNAELSKTQSQS